MGGDFREKLEELKRLAKRASPGPWEAAGEKKTVVLGADGRAISTSTHCAIYKPTLMDRATGSDNAAYIAAANPAMILRMIRELEQRRENEG